MTKLCGRDKKLMDEYITLQMSESEDLDVARAKLSGAWPDDDPQSTPDPREPEPDIDVDVPTFQYLTEGFDPNQIKKRLGSIRAERALRKDP